MSAIQTQPAFEAADLAFATDPSTALHGLVLLVGGLALVPICVALVRRVTPRVPVFFARWRFTQLAVVLALGALALPGAGQALVALFPEGPTLYLKMLGGCLGFALTCGVAAWIAHVMDPDGLRSLGLWRGGQLRSAGAGLLAYALCLPALFALAMLWPYLYHLLGGAPQPQAWFGELAARSGPSLVLLVLLVVVVQPLFEELLFRSFMQPLFVQNLGDRGGVIVTSLLFAGLHGPAVFLPIFGLSLLLGALKLRTQRISAPWVVHALHNGLMVALSFAGEGGGAALGALPGGPGLLG